MESKFGTKNTEEVLVFLFSLGNAVKLAKGNDGKIDINDATFLLPVIPTLAPALAEIESVKDELADLEHEELERLAKVVAMRVGQLIGKEEMLVKIEKGLAVALALIDFTKEF